MNFLEGLQDYGAGRGINLGDQRKEHHENSRLALVCFREYKKIDDECFLSLPGKSISMDFPVLV